MTPTKSTALARPKHLSIMADRLQMDTDKLISTLKDSIWPGCTDSELMTLCVIANELELNPLRREIYGFKGANGKVQPVVGIDGWVTLVQRQPSFDGMEFEMEFDDEGHPTVCWCTIYLKNKSHPCRIPEYFVECKRDSNNNWRTMPRRMLRHKSLMQCARYAFGFGGIYDEDEARDIVGVEVAPAKPSIRHLPPVASKPKAVKKADLAEDDVPMDSPPPDADATLTGEQETDVVNHLASLQSLMDGSKVNEDQVIGWLVTEGRIEGIVPLEEVPMIQILNLITNWKKLSGPIAAMQL